MARKKSQMPKWTGEVAQAIDTGIILRFWLDDKAREADVHKHLDALFEARFAKLPEVARQLGIKTDDLDLSTSRGRLALYRHLCVVLLVRLGVPGFQEEKKKWSPSVVRGALILCERKKAEFLEEHPRGRWNDFETLLALVKQIDPGLGRTAAKKRAKQLRNRVGADRVRLKREHAEKERHLAEQRALRLHS